MLAADDPAKKLRALVFSKTAGFRHDSIPAGVAALQGLGTQKNWQVDSTEDASLFTDAVLSHYDVVIFVSTTGDVLNDAQQAAFERFIRAGKGYVGIHAAADAEYDWRWYGKLVGAYFRNHPAGTPTATVVRGGHHGPVHGRASRPAGAGLTSGTTTRRRSTCKRRTTTARATRPACTSCSRWTSPPTPRTTGPTAMDDDHPISWCQRYDGGRSWYTGIGHTQASFAEAGLPVAHRRRHRDRGGRAAVRGVRCGAAGAG